LADARKVLFSDVVLEILVIKAEYTGYGNLVAPWVDSEIARFVDIKARGLFK